MVNNDSYNELLVKYLADEANAEEKVFVQNWLKANEDNQCYYDRLKEVWQLLSAKHTLDYVIDEVNVDEKWTAFKQKVAADEAGKVTAINTQAQFEDEFEGEQRKLQKSIVYRFLLRTAVAASVLLVIALGWNFFFNHRKEVSIVQNTEKKLDTVLFAIRHEVNNTGVEKRIQLSDGSLIVLANNSEVTCREPFVATRDITLKGKAYFKVAKDHTKPFTVISNSISTTALGTAFTVTSFEKTNRIIVRLYEGRVVIKPVDRSNQRMKNDVFLLPGQEFIYNIRTKARVKAFELKMANTPEIIIKKELVYDNPSIPQDSQHPWYMFNNQSLDQVLNDLAALYDQKIIFNKKDVQNIYFTSKYNRFESLETILKRIGTLNNLKIAKIDSAFVISK